MKRRELDAMVAEALGWTRIKRPSKYDPAILEWWKVPESQEDWHAEFDHCHTQPRFSTSPADALAGLEATGADYCISKSTPQPRDGNVLMYSVLVIGEVAYGPDLCLAVCQAILAWSGAKGARPHAAGEGNTATGEGTPHPPEPA